MERIFNQYGDELIPIAQVLADVPEGVGLLAFAAERPEDEAHAAFFARVPDELIRILDEDPSAGRATKIAVAFLSAGKVYFLIVAVKIADRFVYYAIVDVFDPASSGLVAAMATQNDFVIRITTGTEGGTLTNANPTKDLFAEIQKRTEFLESWTRSDFDREAESFLDVFKPEELFAEVSERSRPSIFLPDGRIVFVDTLSTEDLIDAIDGALRARVARLDARLAEGSRDEFTKAEFVDATAKIIRAFCELGLIDPAELEDPYTFALETWKDLFILNVAGQITYRDYLSGLLAASKL